MDEEKREQLKYSKAKIFIKVVEKEGREKYNGVDDKVKKIRCILRFCSFNRTRAAGGWGGIINDNKLGCD